MKKHLRLIIMILISPLLLPALAFTYSMVGIAIVFGLISIVLAFFGYLGDDDEWEFNLENGLYMTFGWVWMPFVVIYGYWQTGKFNLE